MSFFTTALRPVALAGALALSGGVASAATFDFADIADSFWDDYGYEGSFAQIAATPIGGAFTSGGVTLSNATATSTSYGSVDPHAFFDSNVAGLGVCSFGYRTSGRHQGKSTCSTGVGPNQSDDNITDGEVLTLLFDQSVSFSELRVLDHKHNTIASGTIVIDGMDYTIANSFVQGLDALGSATTFTFAKAPNSAQIYLNSATVAAVPLPAAFGLLLAGVGGLGLAGRRRRKAA